MPLSDTAVRQAKPRDKDYTLPDLDGLSLFVAASGTKSWHFRFTWQGKRVRISFGTYPELSLKDARQLRDEARSQVAKGIDPRCTTDVPEAELDVPVQTTFRDLAERWYAFKSPRLTQGRKGSAAQCRAYLDKDILPALGDIPVREVTRKQLLQVIQKIEERQAFNIAEKCRNWLHQIYRYGLVLEEVEVNVADGLDVIAAIPPPVSHNPILRMDELPEFLQTLNSRRMQLPTRNGLKLLLLTGVRNQELRYATQDQFDLENGLWTIPPDAVKQLRSRLRTEGEEVPPYLVPLSRQAIALIKELKPLNHSSRLLLPGRNNPNQPMSENTLNTALKRMGYEGRLTSHGIRGTLSTALNELKAEKGYDVDWIEAQLSHAGDNKVRGSYNHAEYVEQRRGMMQEWADLLDQLAREASTC